MPAYLCDDHRRELLNVADCAIENALEEADGHESGSIVGSRLIKEICEFQGYRLPRNDIYQMLRVNNLKELLDELFYGYYIQQGKYMINFIKFTQVVESFEEIAQAKSLLANAKRISVDCEFYWDGSEHKLALVQVGSCRVNLIFDVSQVDHNIRRKMMGFLKSKFESPYIEKVLHDVRADSRILFQEEGIRLKNVLDTQVYWDILNYPYDPLFANQRISLNNLLINYNMEPNQMKAHMVKKIKRNRYFWLSRPLSEEMIDYAADDVSLLFELNIKLLGDNDDEDIRSQAKSFTTELCQQNYH